MTSESKLFGIIRKCLQQDKVILMFFLGVISEEFNLTNFTDNSLLTMSENNN